MSRQRENIPANRTKHETLLYDQDFNAIKAKCLQTGTLWQDPKFLATPDSINIKGTADISWRRPQDVCESPRFFVDDGSRFDVIQGDLGDCWLLAALASLTLDEKLLFRVCPPDQGFAADYCGIFRFNFWHQGQWIQVCVDDRLPVCEDGLAFVHSATKNEFWSSLLEKAYAKLHGSYGNLKGGHTVEAMEDFTGGVAEAFSLAATPDGLTVQDIGKALRYGFLISCAMEATNEDVGIRLDNGLIKGHAYSVTAARAVTVKQKSTEKTHHLLRLWNPFGDDSEWKGAWSDGAQEWEVLSSQQKRHLSLVADHDGEFWMTWEDFKLNFTKVEMCSRVPERVSREHTSHLSLQEAREHGNWLPGVNAGGCRNYQTFWTNPQFRVKLTAPDDDDDEGLCSLTVALLQKDRRRHRTRGLSLLSIGYAVYEMKEADALYSEPADQAFFSDNTYVAKSSFRNTRTVTNRHKLPPGIYVILPSTFEPNQEAEFLLRVFTEKHKEIGRCMYPFVVSSVYTTRLMLQKKMKEEKREDRHKAKNKDRFELQFGGHP